MASNYDKGFIIEHIHTGGKRITCRDCNYYESSDKSCMKTPRVFPESGYESYKYCKFFELDRNADYYDEKQIKLSGCKKTTDKLNTTVPVLAKKNTEKSNNVPKVNEKNVSNLAEKYISDDEFKRLNLIIVAGTIPRKAVRKAIKIYLDNGDAISVEIWINGNKAYLDKKVYPQLYIMDEVKRINKKKI